MPDPLAPLSRRRSPASAVLLAGGVLALFALLWAIHDRLGPFWILVAGVALLWPIRKRRAAQAVFWAGGLAFGAYVFDRLAGVLAPFIAVFVVAYLFNPVVTWAERKGVPRWGSALTLTLVVTGAVVGGLVLLVPAVLGQVEQLTNMAVNLALQAPRWVAESDALARAEEAGFVNRQQLVEQITTLVPAQIQSVFGGIPAFLAGLLRRISALIGLVTTAALIPVLFFFCLKDYRELRDGLVRLLPRYAGRREYLENAARVFGNYVRGILTVSSIISVIVAVPLVLLGVPYSLLLGIAAGLLNLIPSLGSILTYVLGVVLMLLFGTTTDLFIVLGVLAGEAIIEQAVLTPNIMSQQVGLHPVVVLLALFACGALFGLLGLVLAVPAAALVAGVVRARHEALVIELADESALTL